MAVGGFQQGRCFLWVMPWLAETVRCTLQASASQGCGRHQAQQAPTASPLLVMSAKGHLCSQPETQSSAHGGGQLGTQASPRRAASNLGAAIQAGEDDDEEHAEERAIVIAEEPAGAVSKALTAQPGHVFESHLPKELSQICSNSPSEELAGAWLYST